MLWFYYIVIVIIRGIIKLLTRCQVRGKENIPRHGPLLIVANHLSLADPPLLGVSFGRKVTFMAKQELFRFRLFSYFLNGIGAFSVRRGQMDRKAIRQAYQVFDDGAALVMFPEGTRSRNGQLQFAFSGPTLIAVRSGVPVLPVGVIGTERIKGVSWLLHRPRITVNIGRPFYLPAVSNRLTKGELAELTNSMMGHIAELLPPKYRGCYGTRKLDDIED